MQESCPHTQREETLSEGHTCARMSPGVWLLASTDGLRFLFDLDLGCSCLRAVLSRNLQQNQWSFRFQPKAEAPLQGFGCLPKKRNNAAVEHASLEVLR